MAGQLCLLGTEDSGNSANCQANPPSGWFWVCPHSRVVICSIVVAECHAAKLEGVSAPEGFELVLSELSLAFSDRIAVNHGLSSLILWLSIHFLGGPLIREWRDFEMSRGATGEAQSLALRRARHCHPRSRKISPITIAMPITEMTGKSIQNGIGTKNQVNPNINFYLPSS
jgi:hypothetical protein